MNHRLRITLLLGALACGGAGSTLSACLIPDYCIFTYSKGDDWCRRMMGARMWPAGQPELATPIQTEEGAASGCRCMNSAEHDILSTMSPPEQFVELSGELAILARQECAALVPEGFEHNCMTLEGPDASGVDVPIPLGKSSECIGDCAYSNPPPGKDCPNPDPYECNDQPPPSNDDEADEAGTDTTTQDGGILMDLPRAP